MNKWMDGQVDGGMDGIMAPSLWVCDRDVRIGIEIGIGADIIGIDIGI